MKKLTVSLLLLNTKESGPDIHYLCGAEPPEGSVLIKNGSRCELLVSSMEKRRLDRQTKPGVKVLSVAQLGLESDSTRAQWVCTRLEQLQIKKVGITPDFPVGLQRNLIRRRIKTVLCSEPVCPKRAVKSDVEIKSIRLAQRAAVQGIKTAQQLMTESRIAPGGALLHKGNPLISEMVRAVIHKRLMDFDCTAEETIVAGGIFSADPHERGAGPLRAGEPIVIDIFPRHSSGYWGDITRTVCRGPAPAKLKKMYNAVKAAQAAALKKVKAGTWTDAIHKAAAEELERRGFKTETLNGISQGFIHGTGHGLGLEIHEAPRISAASRQKLRAGNVITIEPGLYYPDFGGVRIEDTILVTKDGYKMLAPGPKHLEI